MKIFISSMIHSEWYKIRDLIAGGFNSSDYIPDQPRKDPDTDWLELGIAVEKATKAGFFTADQIVLLTGSDSRIDACFEHEK